MVATGTRERHVTHRNHQNKKRLEGQDTGSNPQKMKCWSLLLMSAYFFFRSSDVLFPKKLLREQIKWAYFQSNICGGLREAMEL